MGLVGRGGARARIDEGGAATLRHTPRCVTQRIPMYGSRCKSRMTAPPSPRHAYGLRDRSHGLKRGRSARRSSRATRKAARKITVEELD